MMGPDGRARHRGSGLLKSIDRPPSRPLNGQRCGREHRHGHVSKQHSGFTAPFRGAGPSAMDGTLALVVGIRHRGGSMTQLLGQEGQDPIEGHPGRMPRLVGRERP